MIKGLAITAGSKPIFFAASGSVQPTILAISTVIAIVRHTTSATASVIGFPSSSRSTSMILPKHSSDSAVPQSAAVSISFHTTRGRSAKSSSPRLSARMIVTEACEPELPPVSISIGIKAVSTTWAASALSKPVMIMPVNVADTISSASHGMRWRKRSHAFERR